MKLLFTLKYNFYNLKLILINIIYFRNILTNINTYCEKILDMTKLKNHLSTTLTFFHLYWNDIKEVLIIN